MNATLRQDLITHWEARYEELTQELRGFEMGSERFVPDNIRAKADMRQAIWERMIKLKFVHFTVELVYGALPADCRNVIPVLYKRGCGDCS